MINLKKQPSIRFIMDDDGTKDGEEDTPVVKIVEYGILPPKKPHSKTIWDDSANRYVGKKLPSKYLYKDTSWDGWYVISEGGDPRGADKERLLLDAASINRENMFGIPECTCNFSCGNWGCTCGTATMEKKFANLVKERLAG
jgi:hypothetical protein